MTRKKAPSSRWRLESINVTDFRGILGTQIFQFQGLSALVWGENGVGKSTVALALEWILFGAFPSGALGSPRDVFMSPVGGASKKYKGEIVFVRDSEKIIVRRDGESSGFTVECGGKKKKNDSAAEFLEQLLGLDMDTFVRAVLLQQRKIRGLLLDEPKERAKALDRLLGIDAAEAVLESLRQKPFKDAADAWRENVIATEARLQSQSELLEKRYKEADQEARANKFMGKDLSATGLKAQYSDLNKLLIETGRKYGLDVGSLPDTESVAAAKKASIVVEKALGQIRVGAEVQKKLAPIERKLGVLQEMQESWKGLLEDQEGATEGVNRIAKANGDAKAVAKKRVDLEIAIARLQDQLLAANELRALLLQAHAYFRAHSIESCPVCEQGIAHPHKVAKSLADRVDALTTKSVRDIEKKQNEARQDHKGICDIEKKLTDALQELKAVQARVDAERKKVMRVLEVDGLLEKMIATALEKAIGTESKEHQTLSRGVASLEKELEVIATRDRAIRDGLIPFIEAREDVSAHEKARQEAKKKYGSAEKQATELDNLVTDVERIRKALLTAKEAIATETLGRAGSRAQELYRLLVRHKLFDQLDVRTAVKANKMDYAFEVTSSKVGKSTREARLVLSDGQLTAAALALFYALAESGHHSLDLLYIDDPTQNLDHPHKEAMAKVIADLAKRRQVVVSTQDDDFVTLLRDTGFEEGSVVHHIEAWDRKPEVKTRLQEASQ